MFIDVLQRGVFKGSIGALLAITCLEFVENGPVLNDFDTGEPFKDPAFRRVECKLGLFRHEALVHYYHAIELCDIGTRIHGNPFDKRQRGGEAVWGQPR